MALVLRNSGIFMPVYSLISAHLLCYSCLRQPSTVSCLTVMQRRLCRVSWPNNDMFRGFIRSSDSCRPTRLDLSPYIVISFVLSVDAGELSESFLLERIGNSSFLNQGCPSLPPVENVGHDQHFVELEHSMEADDPRSYPFQSGYRCCLCGDQYAIFCVAGAII